MIHWLSHGLSTYFLHPLGGRGYQFWSGLGSDIGEIAIIGGLVTILKAHNCHVRGCFRLGKHSVDGTPFKVCRLHHPTMPDKGPTIEQVHASHAPVRRKRVPKEKE